jgi:hypothetical protein
MASRHVGLPGMRGILNLPPFRLGPRLPGPAFFAMVEPAGGPQHAWRYNHGRSTQREQSLSHHWHRLHQTAADGFKLMGFRGYDRDGDRGEADPADEECSG